MAVRPDSLEVEVLVSSVADRHLRVDMYHLSESESVCVCVCVL